MLKGIKMLIACHALPVNNYLQYGLKSSNTDPDSHALSLWLYFVFDDDRCESLCLLADDVYIGKNWVGGNVFIMKRFRGSTVGILKCGCTRRVDLLQHLWIEKQ